MNEPSSSPHTGSSEPRTLPTGISKDEVRGILADCESAGLLEQADDDAPLVLDSYSATWIQHLLEERHGVVVQLGGETAGIDSVDSLHAAINRNLDTTTS